VTKRKIRAKCENIPVYKNMVSGEGFRKGIYGEKEMDVERTFNKYLFSEALSYL